jgi:predicted Ser/Thr protein kinase
VSDVLGRIQSALENRYKIEREIGRGGMGVVFLATDLKLNRQVAIKVLRPELSQAVGAERFLREVRIEASLDHPNIVPLFDSGDADGLSYYVMPFIDGESLRKRIEREERLSVDEVVRITNAVADGLSHAHGHGVIHRDIKPENILLSDDRVLLADFGIAKATAEADGETLSTYGIVMGTPEYMSPEQAMDDSVDARTDIYSLGCVVYEMLGGDPPFVGKTKSAIIARHLNERVPSLRVVRADIPYGMTQAVERSLAKVPADRFQTAEQFADALSHGVAVKEPPGPRIPVRWLVLAGVLVVIAVAARLLLWPTPPLDLNRIVAYPFEVSDASEAADVQLGDNLAYLVISALDGLGGVNWVEGRDLLDSPQREDVRAATELDLRRGARANRAGYFLDGRLLLSGDTARVVLALHSTTDESVVARADTSGPRGDAEHVTYSAVGAVLLSLLPDAGRVGRAAVFGRSHEVIQPFVQAEMAFYHGRYKDAFENYQAAVERDPAFSLAAVKGAQAASWNHNQSAARGLIGVAIDHVEMLPSHWAHFARGFEAYLNGRGDTAVYHFEQAIEVDDSWPEGWMGLGETYQHLLPSKSPQDSLAKQAFARVYERTSSYAPALYHLAEFAIREGDLGRASDLLSEHRLVDPEPEIFGILDLALRCVDDGPDGIDWRGQAHVSTPMVYQAGKLLGVTAAHPQCAVAAYRAVLNHDTTGHPGYEWGSLVGLQSLFAATGRTRELVEMVDSVVASGAQAGPPLRRFYIWDAVAGVDVQPQAGALAAELRQSIDSLNRLELWHLGIWDAYRGRLDEARAIRDLLQARLVSLGAGATSTDTLLAYSMYGHVFLSEGDTAAAMDVFSGLRPTAAKEDLTRPYESLGYEHLVRAQVLIKRQQYREALRVLAAFDSPGGAALVFPVFLPATLELRLRAAQALGDERLVERTRERLRAMELAGNVGSPR